MFAFREYFTLALIWNPDFYCLPEMTRSRRKVWVRDYLAWILICWVYEEKIFCLEDTSLSTNDGVSHPFDINWYKCPLT